VPVETTVCRVPACTGTPLAPTVTNAATGTDCTADNKPPAHVCGDTTNAAIAGTCVQCNTIADCPTTGSACVVATCTNNVCGTADAPTDTACTLATDAAAHVCGDTTTTAGGTCVECNVLADCTNPLSVTCLLNMCQ
jgi:hypothetical protein